MRTSFAVVLAMAIGINAVPQATYSVLPISQISDGQIQAPPATATEVPSVPVVTATGSLVVPPVVSSVVEVSSGAPVVPTAPITGPAVTPTGPVVIPSAPTGGNATVPVVSSVASFLNSTISQTRTSPAGPTSAGSSATASGSAPAQPGAANSNMVSLGSLAMAAIAGAILA